MRRRIERRRRQDKDKGGWGRDYLYKYSAPSSRWSVYLNFAAMMKRRRCDDRRVGGWIFRILRDSLRGHTIRNSYHHHHKLLIYLLLWMDGAGECATRRWWRIRELNRKNNPPPPRPWLPPVLRSIARELVICRAYVCVGLEATCYRFVWVKTFNLSNQVRKGGITELHLWFKWSNLTLLISLTILEKEKKKVHCFTFKS